MIDPEDVNEAEDRLSAYAWWNPIRLYAWFLYTVGYIRGRWF